MTCKCTKIGCNNTDTTKDPIGVLIGIYELNGIEKDHFFKQHGHLFKQNKDKKRLVCRSCFDNLNRKEVLITKEDS